MIARFLRTAATPILTFAAAGYSLAASARPNVLLIIFDDVNDSVEGFGGHPQARTPNLDAFAKAGAWFQRAYTTIRCVRLRVAASFSDNTPTPTAIHSGTSRATTRCSVIRTR